MTVRSDEGNVTHLFSYTDDAYFESKRSFDHSCWKNRGSTLHIKCEGAQVETANIKKVTDHNTEFLSDRVTLLTLTTKAGRGI